MAEEQRHLPPVKELLEQMYGVEIEDLTPEEREHIHELMEEARNRRTGQSDT